mmetsp:Transcript_92527/g.283298  ORF Transcript_92527/g.283298 Transcript_92527/m.283298 type:complete len:303 (-) Transcript_92527:62-970(-)
MYRRGRHAIVRGLRWRWGAARSAAIKPPLDPHSVSNTLDSEASERLIHRLEARGRDAIFRSLFLSYFPDLRNCRNVLEIGCGTGVLVRALVSDKSFHGKVTGSDLSPVFLEAARRLAIEEGCPPDRISFVEADANQPSSVVLGEASYDAVIMNTLISHVPDPAAVLSDAATLAAPGARLVVMDGDYLSLSYAHPKDPELGRRMDLALMQSVYAQPHAVRDMAAMLPAAGWQLEDVRSQCVSEVGASASYWVSFAKAYMPGVWQSGTIDKASVDSWWQGQTESLAAGHFFAAANYYTFLARKA